MFDGRIRRQIENLSLTDLLFCPIWQFALDEEGVDGQNEHTLRPRLDLNVVNPGKMYTVVRATFEAYGGSRFRGMVKPQPMDPGPTVTPIVPYDLWPVVMVNESESVVFGFGTTAPSVAELDDVYQKLGLRRGQLFPLSFSSDVPIENGIGNGVLRGFMYMVPSAKPAHKWSEENLAWIE